MTQLVSYPFRSVLAWVNPGRLRWLGAWLPSMTSTRPDLEGGMRPLKLRWGRALLLAIVLFIAMGEFGPSASTIAPVP
jgi:hypothetical protein